MSGFWLLLLGAGHAYTTITIVAVVLVLLFFFSGPNRPNRPA